jgi:hypothetical protein
MTMYNRVFLSEAKNLLALAPPQIMCPTYHLHKQEIPTATSRPRNDGNYKRARKSNRRNLLPAAPSCPEPLAVT